MSNLHRLIFFLPPPTPSALEEDKEKATVSPAETELIPLHIHIELVFPITEKSMEYKQAKMVKDQSSPA